MNKIVGWTGSWLLALCALPQVIQTVNTGTAEGLNPWFLGMWAAGELLTLWYVLKTIGPDRPLVTNYLINLSFIAILIAYL